MKKTRVLLTAVLSLALAGTAMAQTPYKDYKGKIGGADKTSDTFYKVDGEFTQGGPVTKYVRIDKDGTIAWVSFLTSGKELPYFVAPSFLTQPNFNPEKELLSTATSTWEWKFAGKANSAEVGVTAGTQNKNLQLIKANDDPAQLFATIVTVEEKADPAGPFSDCTGATALTEFLIQPTGKPTIFFQDAVTGIDAKYVSPGAYFYDASAQPYAIAEGDQVVLIQSCKKDNLKNLNLLAKLEASEAYITDTDVPEVKDLQKYAFAVKSQKVKIKDDFAIELDGPVTEVENYNPDGKQEMKTTKDVTIKTETTFDGIDLAASGLAAYELLYYLDKPKAVTTTGKGCVSAVSHRSDNKAAGATDLTLYPFGLSGADQKPLAVAIRLVSAPKTGPIYHIPNSANI